MNLEANSSLIENVNLVDTLIAALGNPEDPVTCAQTPDPQKIWDDLFVDLTHYVCDHLLYSNRKQID